jgi:hypothetical protein
MALVLTARVAPGQAAEWQTVSEPSAIMEKGYIQVVAGSEAGQTRFRALRAATVAAQRDLLEVFQGVTIAGETTVKDGMLLSDRINSEVQGFLRGATRCGESYDQAQGYAEVCMRLLIRGRGGAYEAILPLLAEEGVIEKAAPRAAEFTSEAPLVSDGLLVDVRNLEFKPAMVNRILTEDGALVFGPSRVVNTVLVERGCGGYTNQMEKGTGLLAVWGSMHPRQVMALEVRKGTDVVISTKDAAEIFSENEKTSFLSQAKVVFLIR